MSKISRRSLLRGAGAGAGALLLSPFIKTSSHAQAVIPRRFVFVIEGNGIEPAALVAPSARAALERDSLGEAIGERRWWPESYGHANVLDIASPDLDQATALTALAEGGLIEQSTVLYGLSSRIVGGGHTGFHGVLSSARTIAGVPGGATIDHVLASRLNSGGDMRGEPKPFQAIRLGMGGSQGVSFGTCASGQGQSLPMIMEPSASERMLFGSALEGAAAASFSRRGEVLDFALEDVERSLAAAPADPDGSITGYRDAIQALRNRQVLLSGDVYREAIRREVGRLPMPSVREDYALDALAAQFRNAEVALRAGLTDMMVIGSGSGGSYNVKYSSVAGLSSNESVERHDMHHESAAAPHRVGQIHKVSKRHVDLIAELARSLASVEEISERGETMLDHTMIIYLGDNGEQHHAVGREFPMLIVGGRALGLAGGGRTLVYPGADAESEHRRVSNLWQTVAYCAGEELAEFGEEPLDVTQRGVLPELLAG